jgi:Flp pilus assembly protein TadG
VRPASRGDEGHAAVEVALVLPLVAVLLLALVQVGLILRDHVLVVHAAREGARAAAVSPDPGVARRGALRAAALDATRVDVSESPSGRRIRGSTVRVEVRYRSPTDVPLVGRLLGDVQLRGEATMRVE